MINQLNNMTYEDIFTFIEQSYLKSFGLVKTIKAKNKINDSLKAKKLIDLINAQPNAPNPLEFIYQVNEIGYFVFAYPETRCFGAICLLEKWRSSSIMVKLAIDDASKTFVDEWLKQAAILIINNTKARF